jgi:hypothetical protein
MLIVVVLVCNTANHRTKVISSSIFVNICFITLHRINIITRLYLATRQPDLVDKRIPLPDEENKACSACTG